MQANPSKGGLIVRLAVVLAVLAAAGVAIVHSLRETARVKAVNRDTAIDAVTGSVVVQADGGFKELRMEAAGKVKVANIEPGSSFRKGDVLVQLDTTELDRQIAETRRKFESDKARAKIALENNPERKVAEERLATAKRLFDLGNASEEDLKGAQRALDGIVTRRNIEEGENVMVGTMNNAGTVLLTVADMSIIEAEVEVDETDIPFVQMGQPAKIKIDAIPDKTFTGKVTEIGNSPIQTTGTGTTRTATNFKVTVQITDQIPDVRPGFTCTAEITTATRAQAVSVPIQAMTVRELHYDAQGNIIHEQRPPKQGFRFGPPQPVAPPTPTELKPGEKREEKEGVFLMRDGKATFVLVKTGIAGERYLEVLSGLKEGDQVITGPFDSVRTMYEGDPVKTAPKPGTTTK